MTRCALPPLVEQLEVFLVLSAHIGIGNDVDGVGLWPVVACAHVCLVAHLVEEVAAGMILETGSPEVVNEGGHHAVSDAVQIVRYCLFSLGGQSQHQCKDQHGPPAFSSFHF